MATASLIAALVVLLAQPAVSAPGEGIAAHSPQKITISYRTHMHGPAVCEVVLEGVAYVTHSQSFTGEYENGLARQPTCPVG